MALTEARTYDSGHLAKLEEAATENAVQGQRRAGQQTLEQYADWIHTKAVESIGVLHRVVRDKPRCDNEIRRHNIV